MRVLLKVASDPSVHISKSDGEPRGRFVRSTTDSLWMQTEAPMAIRAFDREELQRIDLSLRPGRATAVGWAVGAGIGVLGGLVATYITGVAETDGALPFWGLLGGSFVGSVVGSFIHTDKWETVWPPKEER